ncbi:hypothetical protein ACF08B_38370 [Streptomyces sp. NPDC015139]|uniref:hypothetical protein n=1 Tax=Streptomyces sp. NPDC015139 TaxID=3364942 RepID=UPI0036F9502F
MRENDISTRPVCWRPDSVALEATAFRSPNPCVSKVTTVPRSNWASTLWTARHAVGVGVAVGGGTEVVGEAVHPDLRSRPRRDLPGDGGDTGPCRAAQPRTVLREERLSLQAERHLRSCVLAAFGSFQVLNNFINADGLRTEVENLGRGERRTGAERKAGATRVDGEQRVRA